MNVKNSSEIKLYELNFKQNEAEMSLSDHLEELRQRAFWSVFISGVTIIISLINIKSIVKLFQEPAIGIKFLQFSPGEYFFASLRISLYTGILISSPFILYQIILFVVPGLTQSERKTIIPITLGSFSLFGLGLVFGYLFLAPAALNFFINYGSDVVEPFWSFEQYFDFIIVLLFSTAIAFQLPVIQVFLGILRLVSFKTMVSVWRYVILVSTIAGAILTPSVDPLTQILMSSIIISLYGLGAGVVFLIEKAVFK